MALRAIGWQRRPCGWIASERGLGIPDQCVDEEFLLPTMNSRIPLSAIVVY